MMRNATWFALGLLTAVAMSCAHAAAVAEKRGEEYYDSPRECRDLRSELNACYRELLERDCD